jgi:hypothetical protein
MPPAIELMLDSGAYSAFTQGAQINLKEYTEFLRQNKALIFKPVCLDVIDPKDPEVAAALGYKNFLYMREGYVDAMPVYHVRENRNWLDQMLKETDFIGLSATSIVTYKETHEWYRSVWTYLTDSEGNAYARHHAFGDATPRTMFDYPWYSLDSTTWVMQAGRGGIAYLDKRAMQLNTRLIRNDQYLSEGDSGIKREVSDAFVRAAGIDPKKLHVATKPVVQNMLRSYFNAKYFLELEAETAAHSRYDRPQPFFDESWPLANLTAKPRGGPTKFFFAFSPGSFSWCAPLLYVLGIKHVLLSYYYLTPKLWDEISAFVYDPAAAVRSNPKTSRYLDILNEFLLEAK